MLLDIKGHDKEYDVCILENTLKLEKAEKMKDEIMKLIQDGALKISLDLSRVEYIDSSGVGKILFLYKRLKTINGIMHISNISPALYELFDSLALTSLLKIKKPT